MSSINCINLLEGYTSEMTSREVENLFYENYQKAKNQNQGNLLQTIISQFCSGVSTQATAELNPNLSISTFNNYDKILYLLSTIGIKTDDFLNFTKQEMEKYNKIVPIGSQLYVARLGIAMVQSPELFQEALNIIKTTDKNIVNKVVLDRLLFINGIGGSGKTSVVAKYITDYATQIRRSILTAGPTESQKENLNNSLGVTTTMDKNGLLAKIIGNTQPFTGIVSELENQQKGGYNYNTVQKVNDLSVQTNSADKNSVLVIDEITHFSTAELALINKWAKENNITIIGLGDDSQSGYASKSDIYNIDADTTLCFRSSKLAISLRSGNTCQVRSTKDLYNLVNFSKALINTPDGQNLFNSVVSTLKTMSFRHSYKDGILKGTLITDKFEDWNKIPETITDAQGNSHQTTVGYIGVSNIEAQLSNNIVVKKFNSIQEVQGQEFDYIIYDKKEIKIPDKFTESAISGTLVQNLRDLYTVVSRGKEGAIVLTDQNIYNNSEESQVSYTTNFQDDKLVAVRKSKLQEKLNSYDLKLSTPQPTNSQDNEAEDLNNLLTEAMKASPIEGTEREDLEELNERASNSNKEMFDSELKQEYVPQRCYMNFHLRGIKSENGQWKYDSQATSQQDIGVVLNCSENSPDIIEKGVSEKVGDFSKDSLVQELMSLKRMLGKVSYPKSNKRHTYDYLKNINSSFEKYFSTEEEYKSLKFYVTIRAKNDETDRLVGFSDLSNEKSSFSYGGSEVMALITAEWTHNGVTEVVTLGALPNPNDNNSYAAWASSNPTAQNDFTQYAADFQTIFNSEHGRREIDAPKNVLTILHHSSEFIPIKRVNAEQTWNFKVYDSDLHTVLDQGTTSGSLRRADWTQKAALMDRKYMSISEPLVIMDGEGCRKLGINESNAGQVVYLVSPKPGMSTQELVNQYYAQKNPTATSQDVDGETITINPSMEVRMITPVHRPLSIIDLHNQVWKDMWSLGKTADSKAKKFPQEAVNLGIRMYMQLWNTRANLTLVLRDKGAFTGSQFRIKPAAVTSTEYYVGWDEKARNNAYKKWQSSQIPSTNYDWDSDTTDSNKKQKQQKFIDYQYQLKESDENKLRNYIYASEDYLKKMLAIVEGMISPLEEFMPLKNADGTDYDKTNILTFDTSGQQSDIRKAVFNNEATTSKSFASIAFNVYDDNGNPESVNIAIDQSVIAAAKQVRENKTGRPGYSPWALFALVPTLVTKQIKLGSMKKHDKLTNGEHKYTYSYKDKNSNDAKKEISFTPLIEAVENNAFDTTDFFNMISLVFHGTSKVENISHVKHTNSNDHGYTFRESTAPFRWGIWYYPQLDFESDESQTKITPTNSSEENAIFRRVRMPRDKNGALLENSSGNINSMYMTDVIPIEIADISLQKRSDSIEGATQTIQTKQYAAQFSSLKANDEGYEDSIKGVNQAMCDTNKPGLPATDAQTDGSISIEGQSVEAYAMADASIYYWDVNDIKQINPSQAAPLGQDKYLFFKRSGRTQTYILYDGTTYKAIDKNTAQEQITNYLNSLNQPDDEMLDDLLNKVRQYVNQILSCVNIGDISNKPWEELKTYFQDDTYISLFESNDTTPLSEFIRENPGFERFYNELKQC